MADCERIPGTRGGRCTSPNAITEILDSDGEEVLATNEEEVAADECDDECTHLAGCGCSRCLSADVTTELIDGDPWEVGFSWPQAMRGTVYIGWDPLVLQFTIYPGTGLPYVQVWFESDQDWPDGSIHIYDEDGNPVLPGDWIELDPAGEDWTVQIDPIDGDAGMVAGTLPGFIHRRTWEGEETDLPLEIEVEEQVVNHITFDVHATALVWVQAGGDTVYNGIAFHRSTGTDNLYWTLEFVPDTGWVGGYAITMEGVAVTPGVVYGPLIGASHQWVTLEVDPTLMIAGTEYTGTLTLRGYTDAAGANLVNTDTRDVKVSSSIPAGVAFYIEVWDDPLDRATPFAIRVTAMDMTTMPAAPNDKIENCTPATWYEGGALNLNLTCPYSPPDHITPNVYMSIGEWVNGVLDITGLTIADGSGPQTASLQVYDTTYGIHGETGLTVNIAGVAEGFVVSGIPNVTRGAAFNLRLQAVDNDGVPDTTYVPAGNVDLNLTSSDGSDVIAPLFTDNTGWVAGMKTVSCTISGGIGSDSCTIEADDNVSKIGEYDCTIASTPTLIASSANQTYSAGGINGGAWNEANWNAAFAAAEAAFEGDSTLGAGATCTWSMSKVGVDDVFATHRFGYVHFTVTNAQKAKVLVGAALRFRIVSCLRTPRGIGGAVSWWSLAGTKAFYLKFTESAASYGNGAALAAMSADFSITFEEINQYTIAAGGTPVMSPNTDIYIPIPTSVVNGLAGNDLYVWMYVDGADVRPAYGDYEVNATLLTTNQNLALFE